MEFSYNTSVTILVLDKENLNMKISNFPNNKILNEIYFTIRIA